MKPLLLKISTALVIPLLYYIFFTGFTGSGLTPSNSVIKYSEGTPKDFRNFLLNTDYGDSTPAFWDIDNNGHLDSMKELNFNAVHFYENKGTYRLGYFSQSSLTPTQISNVNTLEDLIHSSPYNMKSVFERVRISQLCYGQRLVYEVSSGGSNTVNYGFSYQYVMPDTYITDSGRTVLKACASCPPSSSNSAGWLCSSIYENIQHTDLYMFRPQFADTLDWSVKPVMRIRQSDFNVTDTRPVVAIVTKNFLGNTIDSVIIHVNNFRDRNGNYNGQYKDRFTFENPDFDSLLVSGSRFYSNGLNYGYVPANTDPCKVDFKVYWFGQVDVWFDKMTVDDFHANILFAPAPDNYDARIEEEVTEFPSHDIFFCDEVSSSNAYCIKYVQDKMHEYNPSSRLYVAFANGLNIISHRSDDIFAKVILDIAKPDIICLDASSFETDVNSTTCAIPINSFTDVDSRVPSLSLICHARAGGHPYFSS